MLSIRGEELSAADIDTVQHSAGDLDSHLLTELQQLRHITIEMLSTSWFHHCHGPYGDLDQA